MKLLIPNKANPLPGPPAELGYVPAPTRCRASADSAQIHTATIHHLPAQELVSPENPLHQRWSRTYNRCILLSPPLAGELAFGRGDNIRVVCRGYKDWWRGQLRERCGIFPVNYVVSNRTSYRLDVFGFDHWINHRFRNQLRLS